MTVQPFLTLSNEQLTQRFDITYLRFKDAAKITYDHKVADIVENTKHDAKLLQRMRSNLHKYERIKDEASDALSGFAGAKIAADKILNQLGNAYSAIMTGSTSAFDTAIAQINILAGVRTNKNLIGNQQNSNHSPTIIDIGIDYAILDIKPLGTEFSLIDTDSGETYQSNFNQQSLIIKGESISFADLEFVARSGDQITFINKNDNTVYNVQYQAQGLPIGVSFLYGDFANLENRTAAMEDLTSSINAVNDVVNSLSNITLSANWSESRMNVIIGKISSVVNDKSEEIYAAESAALTAAKTTYNKQLKNFSLAAKLQRDTLIAMNAESPLLAEKKSMNDIMEDNFKNRWEFSQDIYGY